MSAEMPGGAEGMASGDIGNYKGVMLCNRPKEPGEINTRDRQGPAPFLSRVEKHEALGLNPLRKDYIAPKKPGEPQSEGRRDAGGADKAQEVHRGAEQEAAGGKAAEGGGREPGEEARCEGEAGSEVE